MSYYDFIDFSFFDCHSEKLIDEIAEQLNTTSEKIYDLIYAKIDPLQQKITDEFNGSEEAKEKLRQEKLLYKYRKNKAEFSVEYEVDQDEYDYCYDVFGVTRNQNYLDRLICSSNWTKDFNKKCQDDYRRYNENNSSNYNNSAGAINNTISDEGNKDLFKQFYRLLSKKYHPDANPEKDTSEEMKLINQLKIQWGV